MLIVIWEVALVCNVSLICYNNDKVILMTKIDDVAKLANVSKTTVSRVLNNRGYLSQKTIDKVHAAMDSLNYQPNAAARQLNKNKTNIIGLLFPAVANPFFAEIVELLEKKLYEKGYKTLIGTAMHDSNKEEDYVNQLLSHQLDGLIVGTHNLNIDLYNRFKGLPNVSIERKVNEEIPSVRVDNYSGGVKATEFLIEHGAKHILHTSEHSIDSMPSGQRHIGYLDTIAKNGLTPYNLIVDFDMTNEIKMKILKDFFIDHPEIDGIFAGNDLEAAMILNLIREPIFNFLAQPNVIGYDGTKIMRTVLPKLPTIIQPTDELTTKAIETLEQRLNGHKPNNEYVFPVSLYNG